MGNFIFLNATPCGRLEKCDTFFQVQPPTEDAASQHSYRVYYQVSEWKTLSKSRLDPEKWGWCLMNKDLEPITMLLVSKIAS